MPDQTTVHWQEHLATAGVILLGVLAVLSFGLVVRARSTEHAAPAAPPPAAPTAEQLPIPLPSASPSLTVDPVNSIAVERVPATGPVDLSLEGQIDWVHWGEQGRYALERKADGNFVILEGTPDAPRERVTGSPQAYRWTGGSPLASAKGVTSGVRTCGEGNGFTLTAPVGTVGNTLRLYLGVSSGVGRLEARLSTGGQPWTDRWEQPDGQLSTAAYTVNYRAIKAGKISVRWITEESTGGNCGGVVLFAATVS
ncbi:hypothetical protein OHA21_04270 [Actinoplanes sp. NBC_00393]|uniref:hypothetical protein n=1 Tax=Actinoplanes sp. NBC_00393 TaxID=2975953 RepID=UPI002E2484E6